MTNCMNTTHAGEPCGPDCIWQKEERTYLSPAGVRTLKEHRNALLRGREQDKRLIAEQEARIQRLCEKLEAAESQTVRYERVIDTVRDQRDRLRALATWRSLLPAIRGSMPRSVDDPGGAVARNIALAVELHLGGPWDR